MSTASIVVRVAFSFVKGFVVNYAVAMGTLVAIGLAKNEYDRRRATRDLVNEYIGPDGHLRPEVSAPPYDAVYADLIDRIVQGLEAGAVSISHCPASFLPHSDVDALQFDGVKGERVFDIEGRCFLYSGETEVMKLLMETLIEKGAAWCQDCVDTRALLDLAHAADTAAGWALYRATMAKVFPQPSRYTPRRSDRKEA